MLRYGKRLLVLLAAVLCCLLWVSATEVLPASNGYYSIEFDVDSDTEAFVTGLTADSFTVVQNTVRAACKNGTSPTVTNDGFIDAEKVADYINLNGQADYDTELCWAASASNVLHYTGWGKQANDKFVDNDRLLEEFILHFDNSPGRADYALKWFFNGWNKMQETPGWGHQDDGGYAAFNGYLSDYAFETMSETIELEDHKDHMALVAERLKAGYGAALYTGFHDASGERDGGHGLTLWGYVREKNGAFTHLIYADSDDDYRLGGERRDAANRLHVCKLQPYTGKGEDSWAVAYNESTGMWQVVESVIALCPYDKDTISADVGGTHNVKATQDLVAQRILIDTVIPSYYVPDADAVWQRNVFTTNDDLVFQMQVSNASDVAPENCAYRIDFWRGETYMGYMSDKNTQVVWGADQTGAAVLEENFSQITVAVNFGKSFSAVGTYTVQLTVNPTNDAYTQNNTVSRTFTVVEADAAGTMDAQLAEMGMQDDGTYGATATLQKPEDGEQYFLFKSYGKRTSTALQLLPWRLVYAGRDFPDAFFLERNETASLVMFRLLVAPADDSQPFGEYFSSELTQAYRRIELTSTYEGSENVYDLSSVREGATEYATGEKTTYNVINRSTVDGDESDGRLSITLHLRAYRLSNGASYHLGKAIGAKIAKNKTYSATQANTYFTNRSLVDAATLQVLPADDYAIYAEAEFVNAAGQTEVSRTQVGEITILPQNARVTTEDATEVESTAVTFNVSAVADLDQDLRLGVEYASGDTFIGSTILWIDDAPTSHASVNVTRAVRVSSFVPGATYYYRAMMQVDGTVIVGETKQFTTPHNDLTLDEPLQLHIDPDGCTCYFTPDTDGWYRLTVVGGACGAVVEDNVGATVAAFTSDNGTIDDNCYLTAGTPYVLRLTAPEAALFTITVSRSESSVTDAWVEVTSLTKKDQHSYTAEITAHVPLNSSFTLGMKMESDFWYGAIVSDSFTDWTKETATARVTIEASPLDVIRYRPYIQIGGEERYGDEQTIIELPIMDLVASGMCGEKVTWLLTEDGTLMVTGLGAMTDVSAFDDYRESVKTVIVGNGVTSVAEGAFADCTALSRVMIGASVTSIGEGAFDDCTALAGVAYGGTETQWNEIEIGGRNDALGAWKCYEWVLPHDHNPSVAITDATCTTSGYTMSTCMVCGETTQADVDTPPLGHDLVHHDGKAPTCLESGWTEYDICTRCSYSTYTELAPLGHDLVHHDGKAATCTADGWEAYDTCTRCDYTTYATIAALGHDIVHHDAQAATCTEHGWYAYDECTRGDYTTYVEIPKLGHNLVYHAAQAPTCTQVGWYAYTACSRCDYTTYTELPMTDHSLVHHAAQAPTYTQVGWEAYDACQNCDYSTYVEIAKLDFDVLVIDAATRNGVTLAVKDGVAKVLLAVYDAQGKALAVRVGAPVGGVWTLSEALTSSATTVKAFALDSEYKPLCEARVKPLA